MDMQRLENFAVRLSAQYAAARSDADRQDVQRRIDQYAAGDQAAAGWLRQHVTGEQSPTKPIYRYAVAYIIVDHFGAILWTGSGTITQDAPLPEDIGKAAYFHATRTSQVIRDTTPPGAPEGRVIVTATRAI